MITFLAHQTEVGTFLLEICLVLLITAVDPPREWRSVCWDIGWSKNGAMAQYIWREGGQKPPLSVLQKGRRGWKADWWFSGSEQHPFLKEKRSKKPMDTGYLVSEM